MAGLQGHQATAFTVTFPGALASKQRERAQSISTLTWPPCTELLQVPNCLLITQVSEVPPCTQAPQVSAHEPAVPSQGPWHQKSLLSFQGASQTTGHREPSQKSLLHGTACGRDSVEKATELRELSRACGNFPGSEVLVSIMVYAPTISIGWVGALPKGSGLPPSSPHHVPKHTTQAHFSLNKGNRQD